MRIDPKSEICGIAALKVRDAVRRVARWEAFDEGVLANELKVAAGTVSVVIDYLRSKGYIKDTPSDADERCYAVTTAGRQFMLASGARPLTRTKAATMLANLVHRVKALNADDGYLSRVTKVFVFGSFLTGAKELSDVDLALLLERRYHGEDYSKKAKERIELAEAGGRRFGNFLEELAWPETEVRRFLVDGKRGFSLHQPDELRRLGCEYKEVFPENQLADDADLLRALKTRA